MIDVFFCTLDELPPVRESLVEACWRRWEEEAEVRLCRITPTSLGVSAWEFQRTRRLWADREARTDPYLLVDGDILLPRQSRITELVSALDRHPEFAMLQPRLADASLYSPPSYEDDRRLVVRDSIGGARLCRKGALADWPAMDTPHPKYLNREPKPCYDRVHCSALNEAGWKAGEWTPVVWWHLGAWYSTVWDYVEAR